MAVVYGTEHIKTPLGLCKIAEIIILLIGIILVSTRTYWNVSLLDAYMAGTIIGVIVSAIILILSLTEMANSVNKALAMQFVFHFVWCIYLIIVSSILIARHWGDIFTAAGALGLIAALVYMFDGIISYSSYGNPFSSH